MSEDYEKMKENEDFKSRQPEMMEGYEEVYCVKKTGIAMKGVGTKYAVPPAY